MRVAYLLICITPQLIHISPALTIFRYLITVPIITVIVIIKLNENGIVCRERATSNYQKLDDIGGILGHSIFIHVYTYFWTPCAWIYHFTLSILFKIVLLHLRLVSEFESNRMILNQMIRSAYPTTKIIINIKKPFNNYKSKYCNVINSAMIFTNDRDMVRFQVGQTIERGTLIWIQDDGGKMWSSLIYNWYRTIIIGRSNG